MYALACHSTLLYLISMSMQPADKTWNLIYICVSLPFAHFGFRKESVHFCPCFSSTSFSQNGSETSRLQTRSCMSQFRTTLYLGINLMHQCRASLLEKRCVYRQNFRATGITQSSLVTPNYPNNLQYWGTSAYIAYTSFFEIQEVGVAIKPWFTSSKEKIFEPSKSTLRMLCSQLTSTASGPEELLRRLIGLPKEDMADRSTVAKKALISEFSTSFVNKAVHKRLPIALNSLMYGFMRSAEYLEN